MFFITKNVMVFESRFLFAQLESNAFVLLPIWTQTNEYLTFITSPSPTVYTVLYNRCVTYKFQTFSKISIQLVAEEETTENKTHHHH